MLVAIIGLAVLVTMILSNKISRQQKVVAEQTAAMKRSVAVAEASTPVVLSKEEIPAGTTIKKAMIQLDHLAKRLI
jgi:Flp pilus assembly protein CpaB